jgi:hypothetical protein
MKMGKFTAICMLFMGAFMLNSCEKTVEKHEVRKETEVQKDGTQVQREVREQDQRR